MPIWAWLTPALSLGLLIGAMVAGTGPVVAVLCGIALVATVIAGVHHAEVVAHRVGEPFGTLVLAVAVTRNRVLADSFDDALGRRPYGNPAARDDLRRSDDHLQRRRWHMHIGRRSRAPRADLPRGGGGRGVRCAHRDVSVHARPPCLHDEHVGPYVQRPTTRVRGGDVGCALADLRLHSNRPP